MSFGIWKLALIVLAIFIIFGAGKLPQVMGDIGKGIKNLRKSLKDEDEPEAKKLPADKTEE